MKKIYGVLILAVSVAVISLAGCSSAKDEAKTENLKAVVENLLKGIDDSEYKELKEKESEGTFPGWLDKRFKGHMTEEMYEDFQATNMYEIIQLSYTNKKNIQLEDLKITEKKSYYEFAGELSIKDSEGNPEEFTMEGTAQFDESGLVQYFTVTNIGELAEMLK